MTKQLPRYVVFGEALTDMLRQADGSWRAVPGGSCWNVARVGARLGVPTGFAGCVSTDLFGDEIARAGAEAGLDERFLQRADALPFLAMVTSQHPPHYFFIGADSADLHFDPRRLPRGWREAAEVLHFGGISLTRSPLAERLLAEARAAAAAGKRIAYDPNFRSMVHTAQHMSTFAALAGLASYIKVSDEDLAGLFPGQGTSAALAALRAAAPHAEILFTHGASGMTLISRDGIFEQPAFAVKVADTVGCGDASMAGWITSLLLRPEASRQTHLAISAAAAALAATRAGPYAPSAAEVDALCGESIVDAALDRGPCGR